MTISRKPFRVLLITLLAANVAYFISVRLTNPASRGPLAVGMAFPATQAKDFSGAPVEWKDRWTLLLFLRSTTHGGDELARYAGEIDRRFRGAGLMTVAIVAGLREEVASFIKLNQLSFPVSSDQGEWEARFGLAGHDLGVFLIRPDGEVEFAAHQVRPDDLRQMVEANLLGRVDYDQVGKPAPLAPGDLLPDAPARRLRDGKTVRLREIEADALVFFGPGCPVCALHSSLDSYHRFERSQRAEGKRVAGLFSTRFSEADLKRELETGVGSSDLYIALSGLPGLDDAYHRRAELNTEMAALRLDAGGRVTAIEALR